MKRLFLTALIAFSSPAMAVQISEEQYNILLIENQRLKQEIESLKNGEDRLIAIIERDYGEQNFQGARAAIKSLKEIHPQSAYINQANEFLSKILENEKRLAQQIEEERLEAERLANLNNTGIWRVKNFVDNFGNSTEISYITNRGFISGFFSNSATQNSKLNVRIIIKSSREVDFKLYEYAGSNPAKAYSTDTYAVSMQNNMGKQIFLSAVNVSDRLSFNKKDSQLIYEALLSGGEVMFYLYEVGNSNNNYRFTISSADYFENAVLKQKEKIHPSLAQSKLPACVGSHFNNCAGTMTSGGNQYIGEWKNARMHGQGTMTFANGDKYVGEWKNAKRGQGTYTWANGEKYIGEWKNGERNGLGTQTFANGEKYVGEWKNNLKHGDGTLSYPDGTVIKGLFRKDKYIK